MSAAASTPVERDYSGVPTAELAEIYARYVDCDVRTFADRIGMDERDLKKIVETQNYTFTGLAIADRIIMGLGEDLSALERRDEIHVVPSANQKASLRMAADSLGIDLDVEVDPSVEAQVRRRAADFARMRDELCRPSEAQRERLAKDSARAEERRARKRAQSA